MAFGIKTPQYRVAFLSMVSIAGGPGRVTHRSVRAANPKKESLVEQSDSVHSQTISAVRPVSQTQSVLRQCFFLESVVVIPARKP